MSRTFVRSTLGLVVLVLGGVSAKPAYASLVFDGIATGKGAGVGASNLVLTVQNNPSEAGCVAWNGTIDVVGATACPAGLTPAIIGGDEKTSASHTSTQTVTSLAVLSGESLVVIANLNQPGSGAGITLENLSLTVYSPTGVLLFNSGNMVGAGIPPGGGLTFTESLSGQGTLGFAFILDSTQAAAISPFVCTSPGVTGCAGLANPLNANNRIGLAAILTNSSGSGDAFSVADLTNVAVTTPEPFTLLTMVGGLALVGLFRRFRNLHGKH